jgi:radical SAM superfamily enzyme YgiQ (UPF0313 family)
VKYLFPLSPYNQQRQFEKPVWVYPAHLAAYATHLKNQGHDVIWDAWRSMLGEGKVIADDFQIDVPFEELPYPDRVFTDARNPRWQAYGNYRWHPATHMMSGNLCWWGRCTFCVDTLKLQTGEKRGLRSVNHVIEEIDNLIALGYKEVFDDNGTFPIGEWNENFCREMMKRGRNRKIKIGCNIKPILNVDYKLMAEAGFRFTLVGVESANQATLDKIQKGQKAENAIEAIKKMNDAGLYVHITGMSSYPWETWEDEKKTIYLYHYLLRKGYAKTAQVSIYSKPREIPAIDSIGHKRVPLYFEVYKSPEFWATKLRDIRCWEDVAYLGRGARLIFEEHWRKLWLKRPQ